MDLEAYGIISVIFSYGLIMIIIGYFIGQWSFWKIIYNYKKIDVLLVY